MPDHDTLKKMAQKLRRICLESTAEAGSGHPTSCMSAAEIVSVLFFDEMRWDPRDPSGRRADIFVLSKGHAAPILWAVLHEAGTSRIIHRRRATAAMPTRSRRSWPPGRIRSMSCEDMPYSRKRDMET